MNITVIYGTQKKGSTYNIAQQFIKKLSNDKDKVTEFFLPKDMPNFCRGCSMCYLDNWSKCPDYKYISPIAKSIEEAELIIFTSPVYVFHVTGQMKVFLDHFACQWMIHRPNEKMFNKQALIVSTAAGSGIKSTMQDIEDNTYWWGIGRTYKYGVNVYASNWQDVKEKKKTEIAEKVEKLSLKIERESKNVTPSLKIKLLFYKMRFLQKKIRISEVDVKYWESKGWLGKVRPWKKEAANINCVAYEEI